MTKSAAFSNEVPVSSLSAFIDLKFVRFVQNNELTNGNLVICFSVESHNQAWRSAKKNRKLNI